MSNFLYYALLLSNITSPPDGGHFSKIKLSDYPNPRLLKEFKMSSWSKSINDDRRVKRSLKYSPPVTENETFSEIITSVCPMEDWSEKFPADKHVNLEKHSSTHKRKLTLNPKTLFSTFQTQFYNSMVGHSKESPNTLPKVENVTNRPDSNLKESEENYLISKNAPKDSYGIGGFPNNYRAFQHNNRTDDYSTKLSKPFSTIDTKLQENDDEDYNELNDYLVNVSFPENLYGTGMVHKNNLEPIQCNAAVKGFSFLKEQNHLSNVIPVDWGEDNPMNQLNAFAPMDEHSTQIFQYGTQRPNYTDCSLDLPHQRSQHFSNIPSSQISLPPQSKFSYQSPLRCRARKCYQPNFVFSQKKDNHPCNSPVYVVMPSSEARRGYLPASINVLSSDCNPTGNLPYINHNPKVSFDNGSLDNPKLLSLVNGVLRHLGQYVATQDYQQSRPYSKKMIQNYLDYINRLQAGIKETPLIHP